MDFRIALRALRRRPIVFSAIVSAVALAIAINSALFSILDGLLFRPLPFADPDALVAIEFRQPGGRLPALAYLPEFADQRKELRARVLASPLLMAWTQADAAVFFDSNQTDDLGLRVRGVDARFLRVLGLSPELGRRFSEDDERASTRLSQPSQEALPIIISHDVWRRAFGGDPRILGIRQIAGRDVRIIGVMPSGVKFPDETNIWVAHGGALRDWPPTYARLAPGATLTQLAGMFPELRIRMLRDVVHPGRAGALPMLFGAAVLLLIVTWVQVAALMLTGAFEQLRDIGVRLALGAGRARVLRQFAVQSGLLALLSGTLAGILLRPLTSAIVALLPEELRHGQYLAPDLRTLAFSIMISMAGFILLTLLPFGLSRRATALDLLLGRFRARPVRFERVRQMLLVAQMTLTALLLYVSGVAAHSFADAVTFNYGYDSEHVLIFKPPWVADATRTPAAAKAAYYARQHRIQETVEAVQLMPGVLAAANVFSAPLGIGNQPPMTSFTAIDGLPLYGPTDVRTNSVGVNFIRVLGAQLVAGHDFDDPAYVGRNDVAIVNQTLANRLAPTVSALGTRLGLSVLGRRLKTSDGPAEIIGVVADFVDAKLDVPSMPQMFYPSRDSSAAAAVLMRVSGPAEAALPALRTALESSWGPLLPRHFGLMKEGLRPVLAPYRGQSVLLSLIAACCLPIAVTGLVGALMYSVRVRSREIAIRMALGADPINVRRAVSRRALATVAMGSLFGVALGVAAARVMAHQLFQVSALDVVTIIAVGIGLAGIGWLAAFVPARQAARVSPADALREI